MISATVSSRTGATSAVSPLRLGKPAEGGPAGTSSPEAQFTAFAKLSPFDRMRASVLSSMGLDQKSLDSMSTDQRQKLEEVIKQKIKEGFEKNGTIRAGSFADIKV